MLTDTSAVRDYFKKLGFEPEIADIYLALYADGPQTISALARSSKVERTKIYRLIDVLMESNLIEIEPHQKRGVIKAAPITNIRILISQKEQELKSLQDNLELVQQVLSRNSIDTPAMHVQTYHGAAGVRQIFMSQTKATGPVLSVRHSLLLDSIGAQFVSSWVQAVQDADIEIKQVCTASVSAWQQKWAKQNSIKDIATIITSHTVAEAFFTITQNMDIWDDTVAYFDIADGELYGTAIKSASVAALHKSFFDILWQKNIPLATITN